MADSGQKMLQSITVRRRKDAPAKIVRGSAAFSPSEGKCYFLPAVGNDMYEYHVEDDRWLNTEEIDLSGLCGLLPALCRPLGALLQERLNNRDESLTSPHADAGLIVVDDLLTVVGGQNYVNHTRRYTNKLFTLSNRAWVEKYPSLPMDPALGIDSKQAGSAVVQMGSSLIVIGGRNEAGQLSRVHILDVEASKWERRCDLPEPLGYPLAVICGDELYVMHGQDSRGGYQCFLDELMDPSKTSDVWQKIADPPCYGSTYAALCGQLVAVGGSMPTHEVPTDIHAYDSSRDSWYSVGDMSVGRRKPFVVEVSESVILVTGGEAPGGDTVITTELVTGATA